MHRTLGARLTTFGGWEMPLQYRGIVAEHRAVRSSVGVFDVSHLGKLRLQGRDAEGSLQAALTADVSKIEVGGAAYSLVLNDDAGCIDDVFVYRLASDAWMVVPNAANVAAVADAIRTAGGDPGDEWDRWTILALQGPDSFEVMERCFPGSGAPELKLHRWSTLEMLGEKGLVARTGYTGERGFELYVPAAAAPQVFQKLLGAGVPPVGLGARDTLRLEMGYALYGHELSLDVNPLEAGLGWVVAWDTPFAGREALARIKEGGAARRSFGVVCRGKGVPRQGYPVMRDGAEIGVLTSGNHSPTLNTGIGLGRGPRELVPAEGERVQLNARGRLVDADIVKPPFVKKR
jgi:aminomethyltransferase